MKFIIRPVRWIVGRILLLVNWLTFPKPGQRSSEDQAKVDGYAKKLAIYQFQSCPFCVKVRRELQRLNVPIELRDAKNNPQYRDELKQLGGKTQVPCLRIQQDGQSDQWIYESNDINAYLQKTFPMAA